MTQRTIEEFNNIFAGPVSGSQESDRLEVEPPNIWELIGIAYGGYASDEDAAVVKIIDILCNDELTNYYKNVAELIGEDHKFVIVIYYALCSVGLMDYGASPRTGWIHHEIDKTAMNDWFRRSYLAHWEK